MDRPHFIPLSADRHLGYFHFGALMNAAAMNICIQGFV